MTGCTCTDTPQISPVCICGGSAEAVLQLGQIRRALAGTYTAEGIRVWLRAANRNLDGAAPMHLVMSGRGVEAVREARRVGAA